MGEEPGDVGGENKNPDNFITMSLYKKVERFIENAFGKDEARHLKRTVYWLKKLYPNANEAMLIAAVSHDIERAFRKGDIENAKNSKMGFLDKKHLESHQKKGASILAAFLNSEGVDKKFADKVKMLIEKHETGGSFDQNLLKDADSISFFENNVKYFIEEKAGEVGRKKVKEKFDWMFNRISSRKAKEIARPWYAKALEKLGY